MTMPFMLRLVLVVFSLLTLNGWAAATETGPFLPFSGDPELLVQDPERFTAFARDVAQRTDVLLARTEDAATRKLLWGLRVHLALHLRDDDLALQLADRIQQSQTDPAERAHSGLTTHALVESQRDPVRFEAEFTRRLRAIPSDPRVRAVLVRAREKVLLLTREALLTELRDNVTLPLRRGEPCTLERADAIVRTGHRLRNILPLRDAMLRAYSAALAASD